MTKILVISLLLLSANSFAEKVGETEKVIFKVEPSPFTDAYNAAKATEAVDAKVDGRDEETEAGQYTHKVNPFRAKDISTAAKEISNNINNN